MKKLILPILFFIATSSCERIFPEAPPEDELLDGPIEGLDNAGLSTHLAGDAAFTDDIFTPETGLGPIFVSNSCGSCHPGEGKGNPFSSLIRFTALADSTGNTVLAQGPTQLQNRAIPGYQPEQIPHGVRFSKLTPPINTGLGFLELVPDSDLLAMADPDDKNNDGISGVVNWNVAPAYVEIRKKSVTKDGKYICRFGKKASVYDLLQQTATAYNQDMGITSQFEPIDVYSGLEVDSEVSTQTVNNVVFYLKTLKAPVQRNVADSQVEGGKAVFIKSGCENCHKQTLKTGPSSIEGLNNKTFHPYTDLLLHDMGPGLDDGFTEGSAKTSEWRTAPLWGIGLSKFAQGGQLFLLHDGRAKSMEEAILLHGGEAKKSRDNFEALAQKEKLELIRFLDSL